MSEARPRPRTKAEQRAEMIEQILDAAEHLFARRGLYGVTLKEVAARVGVHTSLLHYYFENKEDLFEQVILRRRDEVNRRRMQALDRYEAEAGDGATVEGALRAFLDTNLDLYNSGGEGWVDYGKLGALVSNSAGWGAAIMDRHFDEVVLRLLSLIKRVLPHAADEDLFWAYHFTTGAQMLTLGRTGRIDTLFRRPLLVGRLRSREGAHGGLHGGRVFTRSAANAKETWDEIAADRSRRPARSSRIGGRGPGRPARERCSGAALAGDASRPRLRARAKDHGLSGHPGWARTGRAELAAARRRRPVPRHGDLRDRRGRRAPGGRRLPAEELCLRAGRHRGGQGGSWT